MLVKTVRRETIGTKHRKRHSGTGKNMCRRQVRDGKDVDIDNRRADKRKEDVRGKGKSE